MAEMRKEIQAALGDGPDDFARARQRARLLSDARRRPARMWRDLAIGAVAAGLGSVLVLCLWSRGTNDGLQLVSSAQGFVFNEASAVSFEPGTLIHVEKAVAHEAVVVLESGELHASITSGLKNIWRFRAGPHEVIVRGTKLSVKWTPEIDALEVAVTQGKVEVRLGDGRIEWVTAGHRLEEGPRPAVAPARTDEVGERESPPDEAPAAVVAAPRAAKPAKVANVARASPVIEAADSDIDVTSIPRAANAAAPPAYAPPLRGLLPEWKKQAEAGHYGRAVSLVEEQGVEVAMQDVNSNDMLLFADAARLVRRVDLGRAALTALRERFAGTADATESAFRLGRLEFDAQRYPEAARWFDAYVKEAPNGAFALEALGRRLDAWRRAGDARAFDAAAEYLQDHPKGAYAPLAHQILGGPNRQ